MINVEELAQRFRQSVQGCTIHPHGPVHLWSLMEEQARLGHLDIEEVARFAIQASEQRLKKLTSLGFDSNHPSYAKELKTKAFMEKTLRALSADKVKQTPALTVDAIVLNTDRKSQLVLIERKNAPFGWALPGGFVELGETTESAVVRECFEETSLSFKDFRLVGVFSEPSRDPRQHTVSLAYAGFGTGALQAKDDARLAKYFSFDELPPLVFDHDKIINSFLTQRERLCLI